MRLKDNYSRQRAMTSTTRALLPAGFYDVLHPDASFEASMQGNIMQRFQQFGYQRVKPPLVEFEESLLAGGSRKMDRSTFRLMDPLSQQMMGLRTDITMQIGRIALSRLKRMPKPLRLCYTGTVLTTISNDTLNPTRQHMQAGAELIGIETVASDVESVVVAVEALTHIGIKRISVDLNFPILIKTIVAECELDEAEQAALLASLAQKDIGPLAALPKEKSVLLEALCNSFGPAEEVLSTISAMTVPKKLSAQITPYIDRLKAIAADVAARCPDIGLTVDLTESRGFDYHTGVSFALFATGIEGEIGRGGRYNIAFDGKTPAIGFTLYISKLLPILKAPKLPSRIYVSAGCSHTTVEKLQKQGYITIMGLEDGSKKLSKEALCKEASRLNCTYVWSGGKAVKM